MKKSRPYRDSRGRFAKKPVQRSKAPASKRSRVTEARRDPMSRKIRDVERAISIVKPKRGTSVKVGETRLITPTKAGKRALARSLAGAKVPKGKKALFTADIVVRYRDPKTGKFTTREMGGVVLPRDKDIRRRKGETIAQARKRVMEARIMGAVMTLKDQVYGEYSDQRKRRLRGSNPRGELKRIKKQRAVRFRVKLRREVL